jgi:predicted RND superfamily exporter protein
MGKITETFLRHLKPVFILVAAGSAGALVYLATNGIRIDYNVESFLPQDDPVIQEYRHFVDHFPRDDGFLIVAIESDSLFSPGVLRDIKSITTALESIPTVDRVSSITNHLFPKCSLLT